MIKTVLNFNESVASIKRYKEIISLLAKYGFDNIANKLVLDKFLFFKKKNKASKFSTYIRLRMLLEELGPVFVKFGQLMSQRVDLFPIGLIEELTKLQDNTIALPYSQIDEIIQKELGDVSTIFDEFDEEVMASASIAQVYKAKLNGKFVVVKVKKPNIEAAIEIDTSIMVHIAKILEDRIDIMKTFSVLNLIKEFKISLKKEVNFFLEVNNIKRFYINFKNNDNIIVPCLYDEYCSSSIIVMEYIEGIKLGNRDQLLLADYNLKKIVKLGFDSVFDQIFKYGFFHADPHGGNIYAVDKKSIAFLDYGSMGMIIPTYQLLLKDLVKAIIFKNYRDVARILGKLTNDNMIGNNLKFQINIEFFFEKYLTLSLKNIDIRQVFDEATEMLQKYKLKIPQNFFLLTRSLFMFESLAQKLNTSFNIFDEISTKKKFFIEDMFSPKEFFKFISTNANDLVKLLKNLPLEITTILDLLKIGKIKIEFEHLGLETLNSSIRTIGDRLVSAIILSALIVGSSLIIHANLPPKIYNIPIIGLITFTFAGIWGLILLFMMIRNKK